MIKVLTTIFTHSVGIVVCYNSTKLMTVISQEYLPVIYLSSMIYYMALAHMIKEAEESQDLLLASQRHRKANIQTVVTV